MKETLKASTRSALIMVGFAVVFTFLMAGTYQLSRERVAANQQAAEERLVAQVLPAGAYDAGLAKPVALVRDALLGDGEHAVYIARRAGQAQAVVLQVTAPDGYAGRIELVVGLLPDGRISGVRVLSHRETPGLGDYIDIAKSSWITVFDGKSLANPAASGWRVKKDGGEFPHRAGATITPRAVVGAVQRALHYFAAHRAQWF